MRLVSIERHRTVAGFMFTIVLYGLLLLAAVLAIPRDVNALSSHEVFEKASKSTVGVTGRDASGHSSLSGSGVAISNEAIVTNYQTVKKATSIMVSSQGKQYPASINKIDAPRDVCTLSVPGLSSTPVEIESIREPKVGEHVYAAGTSRGFDQTRSEGLIASLYGSWGGRFIRTTAPTSPGLSGGGLFDDNGHLIGIMCFQRTEGQNQNFALPVNFLDELLEGSPSSIQKAAWRHWLEKADELAEREDWNGYLEHSQKWAQATPQDAQAWFNLGCAYLYTNHPAQAVEALQKGILINPEYFDSWLKTGQAYTAINQPGKAIDAFQSALRITPNNFAAWFNLGIAYTNNSQPEKAAETYQHLISINPEYPQAWYNLGELYKSFGQQPKVDEVYKKLKTLDRKLADRFLKHVMKAR